MTGAADLLCGTPLFAPITSQACRRALAAAAQHAELPVGATVLAEGAPVTRLAVVVDGAVRVSFRDSAVESLHLLAGSLCGEMEFFLPRPSLATVTTLTPTRLLYLQHADLHRILADNPVTAGQIYRGFLTTLIAKHCAVTEALVAWKLDHVVRQVAHDLRSPIAALRALSDSLAALSADERALIGAVVQRIDGIAAALLPQHSAPPTVPLATLLTQLRSLWREKQAQHRDARAASWAYSRRGRGPARLCCEPVGLLRAVSNVVDNAVQAGSRRVALAVRVHADGCTLAVRDDGCGMPAGGSREGHVPATITCRTDGHGHGLQQARRALEGWGGRLDIVARRGGGTAVLLHLVGLAASGTAVRPQGALRSGEGTREAAS